MAHVEDAVRKNLKCPGTQVSNSEIQKSICRIPLSIQEKMAIQKAQIQSSNIIQNPKLHTLQSLKVIRLEHRTSSALPRIDCSLHLANAWHKSVGPLARLHHRNRSVFEPGHQDAAVSQEFDP